MWRDESDEMTCGKITVCYVLYQPQNPTTGQGSPLMKVFRIGTGSRFSEGGTMKTRLTLLLLAVREHR